VTKPNCKWERCNNGQDWLSERILAQLLGAITPKVQADARVIFRIAAKQISPIVPHRLSEKLLHLSPPCELHVFTELMEQPNVPL
jgi:S-adenosylmethionine:diacylglycerol 3-amino-3-carboxypropyl transferase